MKKWMMIVVVLIVIAVAVWYFVVRKSSSPAPDIIPRNDTVAGSSRPKQMENGTVL